MLGLSLILTVGRKQTLDWIGLETLPVTLQLEENTKISSKI